MTPPDARHGVLVACFGKAGWTGALIEGASGAGKSDLGLRLLGRGWRLVADDRVVVWRSGQQAWGRAPASIRGLIELRTIGILPFPALEMAPIRAVVECAEPGRRLERFPQDAEVEICGVRLAKLVVNPFEASAAEKLDAYYRARRL